MTYTDTICLPVLSRIMRTGVYLQVLRVAKTRSLDFSGFQAKMQSIFGINRPTKSKAKSEEYDFESENVQLIIIPEKKVMKKRTAGLLKSKIRMVEDSNMPLDDSKI